MPSSTPSHCRPLLPPAASAASMSCPWRCSPSSISAGYQSKP
jgi:hypothetical protein